MALSFCERARACVLSHSPRQREREEKKPTAVAVNLREPFEIIVIMRGAVCCAAHRTDIVNLPNENGKRGAQIVSHSDLVVQFLLPFRPQTLEYLHETMCSASIRRISRIWHFFSSSPFFRYRNGIRRKSRPCESNCDRSEDDRMPIVRRTLTQIK